MTGTIKQDTAMTVNDIGAHLLCLLFVKRQTKQPQMQAK